jgi:hypothetical protein
MSDDYVVTQETKVYRIPNSGGGGGAGGGGGGGDEVYGYIGIFVIIGLVLLMLKACG